MADIRRVRKKIALKFIDKKYDRTHPLSQVKKNRACQASPTKWRARSSHRNGRRTATDGDRGGSGRRPWLACFFRCVCVLYGTHFVEFLVFWRKYPVEFFVTSRQLSGLQKIAFYLTFCATAVAEIPRQKLRYVQKILQRIQIPRVCKKKVFDFIQLKLGPKFWKYYFGRISYITPT